MNTPRAIRLPNGIFTIVSSRGVILEHLVHCSTLHEAQQIAAGMSPTLAIEAPVTIGDAA